MRVETLGEGTPSVAVVGAIHGDEPCGARAIERFLAEDPEVREPVKFVVANERALARDERYVEADLNRAFPGDPDGTAHEERLASALVRETDGCIALGIHSTVSTDEPFGTLADADARKARLMRAMPVAHAADFAGVVESRSVNLPGFVNVEAGRQGTDRAAENAYEMLASNFERVPAGEPYATADGDPLRADREFWPVLMSGDGHERLLGYRARLAGPIRAVAGADTDAD